MDIEDENDYEQFGKNAAKLRDEKDLSQAQISKMLGIPQSTYANYETGKRKAPLQILKRLAAIFDVSIDYLLTGENDPFAASVVAAHHDDEHWSDAELEYIELVKKMLLENRGKRP